MRAKLGEMRRAKLDEEKEIGKAMWWELC